MKRVGIFLILTIGLAACGAFQPPNASGPRGNEPPYPVQIFADEQRRETAEAALARLLQPVTNAPQPELQRVTATIGRLPENPAQPLFLPKLGTAPVMTEEETRESLRRFIGEWQELIGSDPAKLSLVHRADLPDGTKEANYEQRPFRYPIRGNYGKLSIRFAPDRRVLNLASTCIPDAERLQAALNAITPQLQPEQVIAAVRSKAITYTTANGTPANVTLSTANEANPRELVTYIVESKSNPDALQFHLAWEVDVSNAPLKKVYLDAVTGDVLGTG